jgi:hypothetical protein
MNPSDPQLPETPAAGSPPGRPSGESWPPPPYTGDEVNAGLLGIVGVFSAVVLLLIVVLLQAWYYTWSEQLAAARVAQAEGPDSPLGRMVSEQERQIGGYRWIDRKQQVVAVPIERAMELVAGEMAAAERSEKKEPQKGEKERGRKGEGEKGRASSKVEGSE